MLYCLVKQSVNYRQPGETFRYSQLRLITVNTAVQESLLKQNFTKCFRAVTNLSGK